MRSFFKNLTHDLHLPKPPFWMVSLALVLVVGTWVPLALVARSRVTNSPATAVHLFQDMDAQPRLNAQDHSSLFVDQRAMRAPVAGTVARGQLNEDDHYHRGYTVTGTGEQGEPQVEYLAGMPEQIKVDEALMLRGQDMYDVYCFTCHGATGDGNGPTHQRAARLVANPAAGLGTQWVQPSDLTSEAYLPEQFSDGRLFNVITNGVRNMPAYGDQIEVDDRWAIVAYVRALQVSQYAGSSQSQASAEASTPGSTSGTP